MSTRYIVKYCAMCELSSTVFFAQGSTIGTLWHCFDVACESEGLFGIVVELKKSTI